MRNPAINDILPSEITPESRYHSRREFLRRGSLLGLIPMARSFAGERAQGQLQFKKNRQFDTDEARTPYAKATSYNNFYEFGTDKDDPARNAGILRPHPWSVPIEGEAEITGKFTLEDILKPHALEERIYRMRCVEAWSMVIPWVGFPLSDLLMRFKPTSKARFVAFTTLFDPARMPGQRRNVLQWPYVEALRMDEAMNPLALIAVGLYGRTLPNQNGAPLRLVTPWKYGFKGIKSIVSIRFSEQQPPTSWNRSAPDEYGFFANVNPAVDHPRWSQKRERRIGAGFSLFNPRIPTLPFNGYAEQVAYLYKGVDLRRFF